jgi:cyanate lyase
LASRYALRPLVSLEPISKSFEEDNEAGELDKSEEVRGMMAAGMSEVFVVSACLGQNTLPAEAAAKLVKYLDLGNRAKDVEIALRRPPKKAQEAETVSKDPLIYRFHEITYVYGDISGS